MYTTDNIISCLFKCIQMKRQLLVLYTNEYYQYATVITVLHKQRFYKKLFIQIKKTIKMLKNVMYPPP